MRRALADVEFHDPAVPLLANADARPITTADGARAELVEHLTAGVDWVAAVERMAAAGVDDVHRGRAGPRPDRPDQADRPGRRGAPARRPRIAPTGSACRSRPPTTA